jgi:RNA polymerase sigma factor (sigma-70 family)
MKNQHIDDDEWETKYFVEESVKKLPKIYNQLYHLYYRDCYKIKEIADILNIPQGTVKYLLYQLRQQIRESLQL